MKFFFWCTVHLAAAFFSLSSYSSTYHTSIVLRWLLEYARGVSCYMPAWFLLFFFLLLRRSCLDEASHEKNLRLNNLTFHYTFYSEVFNKKITFRWRTSRNVAVKNQNKDFAVDFRLLPFFLVQIVKWSRTTELSSEANAATRGSDRHNINSYRETRSSRVIVIELASLVWNMKT